MFKIALALNSLLPISQNASDNAHQVCIHLKMELTKLVFHIVIGATKNLWVNVLNHQRIVLIIIKAIQPDAFNVTLRHCVFNQLSNVSLHAQQKSIQLI